MRFDIHHVWIGNEFVNTHASALKIYQTLRHDKTAEATIRAELSSLTLTIATDRNASFELTSSTVNGKSFSGNRSMTNQERMDMLFIVVSMYDRAGAISRQSFPRM